MVQECEAWSLLWVQNRICASDLSSIYFVPLIARFMGPTWGPPGADRTMLDHVGPINLAIRDVIMLSYMMTLSNGNIFRVTGHLCGKFTGPRWISRTKASDAELWCFFDLHLNKRLSKQPWGWWFETPEWSLWRHRNVDWVKSPRPRDASKHQ